MSGRGELISALRLKTGYPERGANGTARLVDALKYALNEMWGDMPEGLLQEEWRFRYEPVYSSGTLTIDPSDTLAFQIVGSTTAPSLDGTLRGRWIEVLRDGKYHYRRVRDVWFDGQTTYYVIIDKPWDNVSDTGLTFTIFTYEYPYPGDVQLVRAVIKDPENQAERILYTVGPNTGDEICLPPRGLLPGASSALHAARYRAHTAGWQPDRLGPQRARRSAGIVRCCRHVQLPHLPRVGSSCSAWGHTGEPAGALVHLGAKPGLCSGHYYVVARGGQPRDSGRALPLRVRA